jgi:hypothetical protein
MIMGKLLDEAWSGDTVADHAQTISKAKPRLRRLAVSLSSSRHAVLHDGRKRANVPRSVSAIAESSTGGRTHVNGNGNACGADGATVADNGIVLLDLARLP